MEIERLLQVMADGEWHSRASLREALGWADRVVDSQLHQLSQQGLSFESDPQLGLRLPVGLQLLDRERILRALPIGLRDSLQCFNLDLTIDSTNTAAMNWLRDGGRGAALFMAERQSAGRGRRGRTWLSPFAGNLYLSLVWPVADSGSAISGLSLVTALGVVEALQDSGLTGMERLSVKWPNDVWLGDGKLAGILLELYGSVTGSPHVVVGIGINVNLPEAIQREIGQSVSARAAWRSS
jgi:BirA family biotin operon repressor/biotin-[acetyl-CoA-carboxylase] ligase